MNVGILLLAAEGEELSSSQVWFMALLGLVFIGVGLYGIITQRLVLWGRERWLFALIGLNESTPGFATLIGGGYLFMGLLVLGLYATVLLNGDDQPAEEPQRVVDLSHLPEPRMSIPVERPPGIPRPDSLAPPTSSPPSPSRAPVVRSTPSMSPAERAQQEQMQAELRKAEAARDAARREQDRLAKEAKAKLEQEQEAARVAALNLPDPPQPLPYFTYADVAIQESPQLGENGGEPFEDHAPPGGVMVGAIFFIGDNYGASVAGIQPIYQVGDKYVKGKLCGDETDKPVQQLANAGGIVAGMKANTGRIIDAAQLAFGPLDGTKIDPQAGYFGDQVGGDGGFPSQYYAEGRAIGGVYGSYVKGKSLKSLGMYVIRRMQATSTPPTSTPPTTAPQETEQRTFTSSNGQFTIQARFVRLNDNGTVSLQKEDGTTIEAPLAGLSETDRKYVNSRK